MTYHIDSRQRAFENHQAEVLDAIRGYGRLAPAVLEQRKFCSDFIAASELSRQLSPAPKNPGPVRRWLAARVIALGGRLAGAEAGFDPALAAAEDPAAARAIS